jgi:adenylate cyclase
MPELIQRAARVVARIGVDPADSTELRLRKLLLVTVALLILPAAAVWGGIYWAAGEPGVALLPWAYCAASILSLVAFGLTRSFELLRTAQLLLILLAPFAGLLSMGGYVDSSGVIIWSLVAPLGAIAFDGVRPAWRWFAAYLVLLVVAEPLAGVVRSGPTAVSDWVILVMVGMNIAGVSAVAFVLLTTFARQREDAQERADNLLLSVLPREIAEILKAEQRRIADQFEEASILFADVVDFTPLSNRLPPHEVVGMLDHVFSDFDDLADRYGLEKIKTIGDAYMVAAGVPTPRPDHAHALARMALDMREQIRRHARADGGNLELRIGINSGPVVAGVIGRKRFLYDLWGDAVNTASRMESHGAPGQIQITRATYELLRDDFVCEPRGTVEVKGKGPMEIWHLVGPRAAAEEPVVDVAPAIAG